MTTNSQDFNALNETFDDLDNGTDFLSNEKFIKYKIISNYTYIILKYYSIFIIIVGTIFNGINFICFYRMKKRNSQNVYLSALSLADLYNLQIVNIQLINQLILFNIFKLCFFLNFKNIFLPLMKSMYPIVKKINQSNWNWVVCIYSNIVFFFPQTHCII